MEAIEYPDLRDTLKRVGQLRVYVYLALLAVVAGSWAFLDIAFPLVPLLAIFGLAAILTAHAWLRAKRSNEIGPTELGLQLLADIAVIGTLVFFSGGAYNPFISLLLLPVVLAAGVMPGTWVGIVALAAGAVYSLLMFRFEPLGLPAGPAAFALHVSGMWLDFIVSACLIAYFLYRLSRALRIREAELARLREDTLRNEQIIAVASLAAGTAHELGTPLNILALLVEELAGHGDQETVQMARNQVARAKALLARLAAVARGGARTMERIELGTWIAAQLENWRWMRPEALVSLHDDVSPGHALCCDETLGQALLNLLNNAWQVSQQRVDVALEQDGNTVRIRIADRGPGLKTEIRARAGREATSAGSGMGLGLMLANSSIERHGGTVHLADREGGGTVITITLPCAIA
ncbi:MAG: ATP-binding protein [Thiobacillaceae bacterium]